MSAYNKGHDWRVVEERRGGQHTGVRPVRYECFKDGCGMRTCYLGRRQTPRDLLMQYPACPVICTHGRENPAEPCPACGSPGLEPPR